MLASTRATCAWAALGHAVAGFDAALAYAGRRTQFGRPLVSFQLVQDRLVKMLAKVTAMQLYCRRLADLALAGRVEPTLAGLAKSHNTTAAREVLAEARDLLGGNGILLDFHVIRHMADIEAIHTFEGTATIQNLIVGRDITGVSAFRPRGSVITMTNLALDLREAAQMYPDRPAIRLDETDPQLRGARRPQRAGGRLAAGRVRARRAWRPARRPGRHHAAERAALPGLLLRRAARRRDRRPDEPAAQGARGGALPRRLRRPAGAGVGERGAGGAGRRGQRRGVARSRSATATLSEAASWPRRCPRSPGGPTTTPR